MKYLYIVFFAVFLAACNSKSGGESSSDLTGTYTSQDGAISYVVKADKTIKFKSAIAEKTTAYAVDKNKIQFQFMTGIPEFLELRDDGTAVSNFGAVFTKK